MEFISGPDGKTLVWNNYPKPGDETTWSGGRDSDGYARGFGTLIWYTADNQPPSAEPLLYARYWGNMVRGKFEGAVNVHSKRKTHHAIFVDGARATRWVKGTAPSRTEPNLQLVATAARQRAVIARNAASEPDVPAEGPLNRGNIQKRGSPVTGSPVQVIPLTDQEPDIPSQPKIDIDDSIRILVWPPRTLRTRY